MAETSIFSVGGGSGVGGGYRGWSEQPTRECRVAQRHEPVQPPPFASVLQARIIPEVGGDTLWCSMAAVHDSLSDEVRKKLEPLVAVHTLDRSYLKNLDNGKMENRADVLESTPADQRLSRHPVIMAHPRPGERCFT